MRKSKLSINRNRNLFRQEYIDFLGTGAGMKLFCGLPEQEFRKKKLVNCLKNVTELLP